MVHPLDQLLQRSTVHEACYTDVNRTYMIGMVKRNNIAVTEVVTLSEMPTKMGKPLYNIVVRDFSIVGNEVYALLKAVEVWNGYDYSAGEHIYKGHKESIKGKDVPPKWSKLVQGHYKAAYDPFDPNNFGTDGSLM